MAVGGAFASERYGRRPLWLISATGMLFSFIIITALSAVYAEKGGEAVGKAVIPMLFIFFGFSVSLTVFPSQAIHLLTNFTL